MAKVSAMWEKQNRATTYNKEVMFIRMPPSNGKIAEKKHCSSYYA